MNTVAIVPARMAATRFPGKPLVPLLGLPMIEHVRRRVLLSPSVDEVIVATCDEEIMEVVEKAGGKAVMTSDKHERCTDRIAEAARKLKLDARVVINVQGDEPLLIPDMMDKVAGPLLEDPELPAVNLVTPIIDQEEFLDPNAPKVVINLQGDLLYISREPIPSAKKTDDHGYLKLKQLGIIAFGADFLQTFTKLMPTPLEVVESVDMNRALEHGYRVKAVQVTQRMIGVDVPSQVAMVEELLRKDPLTAEYM